MRPSWPGACCGAPSRQWERPSPEQRCAVHAPRLDHFAGLGSSIMSSARLMLWALEGGAVYRPAGE